MTYWNIFILLFCCDKFCIFFLRLQTLNLSVFHMMNIRFWFHIYCAMSITVSLLMVQCNYYPVHGSVWTQMVFSTPWEVHHPSCVLVVRRFCIHITILSNRVPMLCLVNRRLGHRLSFRQNYQFNRDYVRQWTGLCSWLSHCVYILLFLSALGFKWYLVCFCRWDDGSVWMDLN